ncbi:MAG: hypothetical protein QNK05_16750 [Myxococcota bacterium]|nr:hypothetical protein [Myxococcota bacterium]
MGVCAWCHQPLVGSAASASANAPVSHGMCRSCVEQRLAQLPTPAPRPALGAGLVST